MMITIHACCKDLFKSSCPESQLAQTYLKRAQAFGWKVQLRFYKKGSDQEKAIEQAGKNILILDASGRSLSSVELAEYLQKGREQNGSWDLFIGPAEGFSKEILSCYRTNLLSLSKMTFPHKIVIALLLEQIYRSATIIGAHPYDK